jgi:hypothetical protein
MNVAAFPTGSLQRGILEALIYSDIFEHPLRIDELHCYLPVRADVDEVHSALASLDGQVARQDEYYFMPGRSELVEIRRQRVARSRELLPHAIRYGRILGSLPFVRMVALTGSLAVLNLSKNSDFDYMLVTARGRVWTARLFAVALNRLAGAFGRTLCPNLIVSETALQWPLHDLYSARELFQMIPISGFDVYRKVMAANQWAGSILPNRSHDFSREHKASNVATAIKRLFEFLLAGKLGDRLERWEMTRKIARFSKQPGFGEETVFNAEVCQGNFHHHRKWTREVFLQKLACSSLAPPLPKGEGPGVRAEK